MNILLTNDDGYESSGLMLLCDGLSSCGHNVYVVAPSAQRSAFSHSVNLHKELNISKLDEYCGAKIAYISAGTPADCVKFALSALDVKFDLIISGPNNGTNAGFSVLYSGTVGAAEEGAVNGIPAIALSRLGWYPDGGSFASVVEYLVRNLNALFDACICGTLLNINVPDLPMEQIKGVKICPLNTERIFYDNFIKVEGDDDIWSIKGEWLEIDESKDNDITFNNRGYITVTPILLDRTNYAVLEKLKGLVKC